MKNGCWKIEYIGTKPSVNELERISQLVKEGYTAGLIIHDEADTEEASLIHVEIKGEKK